MPVEKARNNSIMRMAYTLFIVAKSYYLRSCDHVKARVTVNRFLGDYNWMHKSRDVTDVGPPLRMRAS